MTTEEWQKEVNTENGKKGELIRIAKTRKLTQLELIELLRYGNQSLFVVMQPHHVGCASGSSNMTVTEQQLQFQTLLLGQMLMEKE